MSTDDAQADQATAGEEATTDTVSPDKSSKPAVAVTTAPHVRVDRGDHSVGGSASSAGTTEEHEVDPDRHAPTMPGRSTSTRSSPTRIRAQAMIRAPKAHRSRQPERTSNLSASPGQANHQPKRPAETTGTARLNRPQSSTASRPRRTRSGSGA